MSTFESIARDVLNRWPAPAMTLAELLAMLEREDPDHRPDPSAALRALERADGIRVIRRPASADAANFGPIAWVLSYRPDRSQPMDPCLATRQLRVSVLTLGRIANTDALAAWARWNHMAVEAARACAALSDAAGSRRTAARRWSDPRSPAVMRH